MNSGIGADEDTSRVEPDSMIERVKASLPGPAFVIAVQGVATAAPATGTRSDDGAGASLGREKRYFDGMLCIMSMMHLCGEFRVIEPKHTVTGGSAP